MIVPQKARPFHAWSWGCVLIVAVPLTGLAILGILVANGTLYWNTFRNTYDWQQRMGGNSSPINVKGGKEFPKADFSCTELNDAELAELVHRMPHLQELSVSGTLITDLGLVAVQRLSRLKKLDVSGTKVTQEAVIRFRRKHTSLEVWSSDDVKRQEWGNKPLQMVADLGGATSLYIDTAPCISLADCRLGDEDLSLIFGDPTFCERVCLRNTNVASVGLRNLPKTLTVLNLAGTQIGDFEIKHLRGVQVLILRGTRVSDAGLPPLEGDLIHLDLRDTAVTDAGLERFTELPPFTSLRFLRLKGSRVANAGIQKLRAALPNTKIE